MVGREPRVTDEHGKRFPGTVRHPEGPFESLDEALELECFHTVASSPELNSDVLPLKKLREIGANLLSEEGDEIYINGTRNVPKSGKLVKSKEVE